MDVTIWALIGKSSFAESEVFLATDNNSDYVLKRTNLEKCRSSAFTALQNEIAFCKKLKHVNLLTVSSVFTSGGYLYTQKPLMSLGSCVDLIQAKYNNGLPEKCISLILFDVLNALEYIHNMSCIHRGIKGSHILLSADGSVKLTGHRNLIPLIEKGVKKQAVHHYPKDETSLLPWLSPEILQQNMQGYGTHSDIYSVGITAVELANGHAPFIDMPTTQTLLEKLNGTMPNLLDKSTIPETLINELPENPVDDELMSIKTISSQRLFTENFHLFCQSCLQKEPNERPFLYLLLKHKFFNFKNVQQTRSEVFEELCNNLAPISTKTIPKDDEFIQQNIEQFQNLNISNDDWDF